MDTDVGQTTYHGNTELRYTSHGKNAKITVLINYYTIPTPHSQQSSSDKCNDEVGIL